MRLLGLLAIAAACASGAWKPLTGPSEVKLEGAFKQSGAAPGTNWEDSRNRAKPSFGTGENATAMGAFRSGAFAAPPQFRCYVSGFPRSPGIRLFLVEEGSGRELPLESSLDPYFIWQERIWRVPRDWQGRTVRLGVNDASRDPVYGWVGITLPEAGAESALLPFARAAYRSTFLMLELLWFLIPGIAIALSFRPVEPWHFAATVLVAAALVAYFVFWFYVVSPGAGVVAAASVLCGSIGWIVWHRARLWPHRELGFLFAAVVLTAVFYQSLGNLYYTADGPGEVAQHRFSLEPLPPDNRLPFLFAEKLYHGATVRPFLIANAHASDRPPLQTAIALLERPFWRLLNETNCYQLLGVGLQCLWLAGGWILLRRAQVRPIAAVLALAFVLYSNFAWQHSVYTWPKLLAAAFCLTGFAMTPLGSPSGRMWTPRTVLFSTCAFTLSMLSHPGAVFTIFGIGMVLALARKLPPLRLAASALLLALLLWAPWRAYQALVDPPGDALLKLHLAGATDENQTLVSALRNAYGRLTIAEYARARWHNVETLFAGPPARAATEPGALLRTVADRTFFNFFPCAGLLNLGLLARLRLRRTSPEVRQADRWLAVSLTSVAIWCVLMFEGGSTYVHQGSFASMLLYFLAMGVYLSVWSQRLAIWLLALQAAIVLPVFVFLQPVLAPKPGAISNAILDPGMAAAALCAAALLTGGSYLALRGRLMEQPVTCTGSTVTATPANN